MSYHDLRDFITQLEQAGELRRITEPCPPPGDDRAVRPRVARRWPGHAV
jgi:3-polyprenyl-4-hydroxybenzoate decarboxylase